MPTSPTVQHNVVAHRYEINVDGHLAVAEYELRDGRQVFTHTEVPVELRGRGLAEILVRQALDEARAVDRKIVPLCSYVAKFIERNREYQPLLAK
ncbi:MAG: GNAT family N-acetyltransferase [Opitutales bacterium]